jgi:hypothetical protein
LLVLEEQPTSGSRYRGRDLAPYVLVSKNAFRTWKIRAVPYACVVGRDGVVEAKGDLHGEVGRLRETLGLPPEKSRDDANVTAHELATLSNGGPHKITEKEAILS